MAVDNLEDIHELVAAAIKFDNRQNWDFDLRGFCSLVEQLVRLLIRAREKLTPGFLGSSSVYEQWGLQNLADSDGTIFDSFRLFHKAQRMARTIQEGIDEMCNVGGIYAWNLDPLLNEDPLGRFKRQILDFSLSDRLQKVIRRTGKGIPPNWSSVFDWDAIPRIRAFLDRISDLQAAGLSSERTDGVAPEAESAQVKLFAFGTNPAALVRGKPIKKITHAQYDVVKTLLEAGVTGLHKRALVNNSKHGDALGILDRLAEESADWDAVIEKAAKAGFGYRLK